MDFDDIEGEPTQKLVRIEKERQFAPKTLPSTQEIVQEDHHVLKKIQLLPLADETSTLSLPKLEFFSTPPALTSVTPPPTLSTDFWGDDTSLSASEESLVSNTANLNEPTQADQGISAFEGAFSPFEKQPKTTLPLELDCSLDQAWEDENSFSEMVHENQVEYDYAITASDDLPIFEELDLFDIDAVLAQQAADAQQQEYEREKEIAAKESWSERWGGSLSLIYVNWDNAETAEQDALRRLGYADIHLSKETRDFIIQAARNARLPHKQEVQLTTQLANARAQLARLPIYDEDVVDPYAARRHSLQAEITEIEQTLVSKMQWVAIKKAAQFLGQGIELDDLIQFGMLGVIAGIQHFDITRNARLLMAVNAWVFQGLTRAIADYGSSIRLPVHMFDHVKALKKQHSQWQQTYERLPTRRELAQILDVSMSDLKAILRAEETLRLSKMPLSIENFLEAERSNEGYSFQECDKKLIANDPHMDILGEVNGRKMQQILFQDLSPREQQVFSLRVGLGEDGNETGQTLEEIGQILGVTRERVRQIEVNARKKILDKYNSYIQAKIEAPKVRIVVNVTPSNHKQQQPKDTKKATISPHLTKERIAEIKQEWKEKRAEEMKQKWAELHAQEAEQLHFISEMVRDVELRNEDEQAREAQRQQEAEHLKELERTLYQEYKSKPKWLR